MEHTRTISLSLTCCGLSRLGFVRMGDDGGPRNKLDEQAMAKVRCLHAGRSGMTCPSGESMHTSWVSRRDVGSCVGRFCCIAYACMSSLCLKTRSTPPVVTCLVGGLASCHHLLQGDLSYTYFHRGTSNTEVTAPRVRERRKNMCMGMRAPACVQALKRDVINNL